MRLPGGTSRAWLCVQFVLLSAFLIRAPVAAAQEPPLPPESRLTGDIRGRLEPPLEPGARVRVWISAPRRQTLVGSVMAFDKQSFQVNVTKPGRLAGTRDLSLENVTRLEVSQGQQSRGGRGALVGGGVGLATGAVAGAILGAMLRTPESPDYAYGAIVALGGIGLVSGVGIGAIIGATSKGERWQAVSLDRLRVSALPGSSSRAPTGVAVRFERAF